MNNTNYEKLLDIMSDMDVVDTHEHLWTEKQRLEITPDFSTLFSHYCRGDLLAARMPRDEHDRVFNTDAAVDEKWALFEPYYNLIRDGAYARAAHIAMEKFYGYSELTSLADAEAVTVAIREANKPGLYKKVLRDACKIRVSVVMGGGWDDPLFAPVAYADQYAFLDKTAIRKLEDETGRCCGNLDAYVDAVRQHFTEAKSRGMKGIKVGFAYHRDLNVPARTHAEAESIFLRIVDEGYGARFASVGFEEMLPFQDYMIHRVCEIAAELDVPVVIHTGVQFFTDHNADDSRPLRLWSLPHRYRKTDFVILHSGFPWIEDAALMAKHYPNVYLDLAWTHATSTEVTTRALMSLVDMVPMNKVCGFGGDYVPVEKVYGHLMLAKQDIARALATKMETSGMTLARAESWIRGMLFDNPKKVYRLDI